jgi:voltage-gated potassium channel
MDAKDLASAMQHQAKLTGARRPLNSFLFDTRSRRDKLTNMIMLAIIMLAVAISVIGTVDEIRAQWGVQIDALEFWILVVFAIEYVCRVYSACNRFQRRHRSGHRTAAVSGR